MTFFNFDPKTKNTNIIINTSPSTTTFADVGGLEDAKESLNEIIDFLAHPNAYAQMGATLPKGILLAGPPGTGKTLLAKALAGEANVPFITASGSDFIEMYAGVGAARIRKLFELAEKNAPCIVFIDEIDTIGKRRNNLSAAASDERDQTLNQLLSEMDGFAPSKGIVVLAATNRPETLDSAISRKGRFDRRIVTEKPDVNCRLAILQTHARNVAIDESIDLEQIAYSTTGSSGADLKSIINEAAIKAVRAHHKKITAEDMQEAMEQVLAGFRQNNVVLSELEKCIVAIHESAHAIASIAFNANEKVHKISIIPRNANSLGYTVNYKESEQYLIFKSTIMTKIRVLLAGYCAEQTMIGEVSSSASDDIERATVLAKDMITSLGMSSELGPVVVGKELISDIGTKYAVSQISSFLVDQKTIELLNRCYNETLEFIKLNLSIIQKVAEELVASETLTEQEILDLIKGESINVPEFENMDESPVFTSFTLYRQPAPTETASLSKGVTLSQSGSEKSGSNSPEQSNSPYNKPKDKPSDNKEPSSFTKGSAKDNQNKPATPDRKEPPKTKEIPSNKQEKPAEKQTEKKTMPDNKPKKDTPIDKKFESAPVRDEVKQSVPSSKGPDENTETVSMDIPDMDIPEIGEEPETPSTVPLEELPGEDETPDVNAKINLSSKKTSAKAKKNAKDEASEILSSFLNNEKAKAAKSKAAKSSSPKNDEPTEADY